MELLHSTIHLNKNQTTSNDGKEIHITVYTSDEESTKEEIQKHKKTKAGSKEMASKNSYRNGFKKLLQNKDSYVNFEKKPHHM